MNFYAILCLFLALHLITFEARNIKETFKTEEVQINVRTKRIHIARVNETYQKYLIRKKRIGRRRPLLGSDRTSSSGVTLNQTRGYMMSNAIGLVRDFQLGSCQGHVVKHVLQRANCEAVTIDSMLCGGVCPATNTSDSSGRTTTSEPICKGCFPLKWKEKLVYFLCYSDSVNRRRRKFEEQFVVIITRCACKKDFCHKQNKVAGGGDGMKETTDKL